MSSHMQGVMCLRALPFTAAGNIHHAELGSIKVLPIYSEFLGHQEQPVFKWGKTGCSLPSVSIGGSGILADFRAAGTGSPLTDRADILHNYLRYLVGVDAFVYQS